MAILLMRQGILGAFLAGSLLGIVGRRFARDRHRGLATAGALLSLALGLICHQIVATGQVSPDWAAVRTVALRLGWWAWADLLLGCLVAFNLLSVRFPEDNPPCAKSSP